MNYLLTSAIGFVQYYMASSVEPLNPDPEADLFWNTFKKIFIEYSCTDDFLKILNHLTSNRSYDTFLQELKQLEDYLASPLNHQKLLSSIPHEISALIANDSTNFLLISCTFFSRLNLTKFLLAIPQIDVNKADGDGNTPLHYACNQLHYSCWIPSNYTCDQHNIQIVQLLLNVPQIDINKLNKIRHPPMHIIKQIRKEVAETLLLQPTIKLDLFGRCQLWYWAKRNRWIHILEILEICEECLEVGGDITLQ